MLKSKTVEKQKSMKTKYKEGMSKVFYTSKLPKKWILFIIMTSMLTIGVIGLTLGLLSVDGHISDISKKITGEHYNQFIQFEWYREMNSVQTGSIWTLILSFVLLIVSLVSYIKIIPSLFKKDMVDKYKLTGNVLSVFIIATLVMIAAVILLSFTYAWSVNFNDHIYPKYEDEIKQLVQISVRN